MLRSLTGCEEGHRKPARAGFIGHVYHAVSLEARYIYYCYDGNGSQTTRELAS